MRTTYGGRPYGANSYVQTEVQTATPLQLVVIVYDAAVRAATTAIQAIDRRDIPVRRAAINTLLACIAELQNTLDAERGGKVASDLDALYAYMVSRLLEAISKQDSGPVEEVRGLLQGLREAWHEISTAPAAAGSAGSRA